MMLEIKNLSKNFEKIQALENINLHVKEGEFL
ncbi:ABC transporter ATP-binding protein, partial [Campylobacter jejuni]|nr:ABC transporter ATP-binding protein [Campylobacter jejuni]EIC2245522.1 ABC transporter ATP-binding protein [Campylobacter jejuni]EIC2874775.1 ABC transporter ATP-binding protein [Campylobacter jejuni]